MHIHQAFDIRDYAGRLYLGIGFTETHASLADFRAAALSTWINLRRLATASQGEGVLVPVRNTGTYGPSVPSC
jgi:hypothetical protein